MAGTVLAGAGAVGWVDRDWMVEDRAGAAPVGEGAVGRGVGADVAGAVATARSVGGVYTVRVLVPITREVVVASGSLIVDFNIWPNTTAPAPAPI